MRSIITCVFAISLAEIITPAKATNGPSPPVRDVSHEDIRDAILSLVHMYRDNIDKLERHESRERQLGDQLKKTLSSIEKKHQGAEGGNQQLLETLNTINRRLESIETTISNKEKSASVNSDTSTTELLQSIQEKIADMQEKTQKNELLMDSIRTNSQQKQEQILSDLLHTQSEISSLNQKFSQSMRNMELTDKMGTKLLNNTDALHEKLEIISKLQQSAIEDMKRSRQSVSGDVGKGMGRNNQFPDSLVQGFDELRNIVLSVGQNGTERCREETEKTRNLIRENQEAILLAISATSALYTAESKNTDKKYDELLKEFKDLSKVEQVLIQTADNVLDTKRRIEYGTHQILREIGEMITLSSKETNETVNRRFNTISVEILDNTKGALQNLSSKLEIEISQVWRQIGIMYQILTNSADSLDKLQQQTETYVNGSLSTMDSMKGKVGQITSHMNEVHEDLNYLLGRLSLVTQEFNQIKTGLGEALDNVRKSFHTVQDKVKDVGPGPNPIEDK